MDPDLMRRVEGQIDRLLRQYKEMEDELARVRVEKAALEADRRRVCIELDRILEKLDSAERKVS